jgi:hypothetical protein
MFVLWVAGSVGCGSDSASYAASGAEVCSVSGPKCAGGNYYCHYADSACGLAAGGDGQGECVSWDGMFCGSGPFRCGCDGFFYTAQQCYGHSGGTEMPTALELCDGSETLPTECLDLLEMQLATPDSSTACTCVLACGGNPVAGCELVGAAVKVICAE